MTKLLVPLGLLLLAGCSERSAETPTVPQDETDVVPKRSVAGPELPYLIDGACPFECCTYGSWTAERALTAYSTPGDTTGVAFTIEAGTSFEADSGYVAVTQAGLAIVDQPMQVWRGAEDSRAVAPGDTLYLLDYVGEGIYNAWLADSLYQIEPAVSSVPDYRTLREPEQTWWVHTVLPDGRAGWLWMDQNRNGAVGGYDACGAP